MEVLKILVVAQSGEPSGASHSMVDLARGLREAGHSVLVLVPRPGVLMGMLEGHGLPFERVDAKPWVGSVGGFKLWRRMRVNRLSAGKAAERFKGQGFDLVYTNTITSPFGGMLAKHLGIPNVWQIRENLPSESSPKMRRRIAPMQRTFQELATLAIGNSRHVTSQIERWVPPERVRLVYSGPFDDDEAERPVVRTAPSGGPFELLLLGRVAPQKRQEEAVRGLKHLADRGLDVRLTLAGSVYGGYDQVLRRLAHQLGVSQRLQILPYVTDARALYERAHVNLNCTFDEPLGRTILEGMAFGCPTVAAAGGGTPELIQQGQTGLLYKPGDDEGLADCVAGLLEAPDDAASLAERAREAVLPKFTRTRYTRETLVVFQEAITSHGR